MGPVPTAKKASSGGKPPGPETPPAPAPDPSAPESAGHAASTAFGEIRSAVPVSSIGDAVSHIPGGGLATSAFKVAEGFGGSGIALGSAGASAISKRRRKSKARSEIPEAGVVNETRPVVDTAVYTQVDGVSKSPESPSRSKPGIVQTQKESIAGYQPGIPSFYTKDRGVRPATACLGGYTSSNELPPILQYTSVQPYADEDGIEHDNLDFTNNIQGIDSCADGHMKPSDQYAPTSEIINVTHQLEPVIHERVRRVEVEEVTRQIIHDRHIHHIQHHTQPVIVREVIEEKHHEKVHPSTTVLERHVNNADDLKALDAQVKQHGNTKEYLEPEHSIIDRGSMIKDNVHHHIHHVVQPVFEKDTTDNHCTYTSIPIKETVHDLTSDSQSINEINGKENSEGKQTGIISGAQLVRSPSIHCKGCKCHEMDKLGEPFEKNVNISESPRQDTGFPGINGEPFRKTSIPVIIRTKN